MGAVKKELTNLTAMFKSYLQDNATKQQLTLQPIFDNLLKYLTGDIGFSPDAMATMDSMALNNVSQYFGDAGSSVRDAILRSSGGGGSAPLGGGAIRGLSRLEGQKAATTAQLLNQNRMENFKQALLNKFNTAQLFQGNAAQYGSNFGTGVGGLLGTMGMRTNIGISDSQKKGFGDYFKATLGEGLAKILTGGVSKAAGSLSSIFGGS